MDIIQITDDDRIDTIVDTYAAASGLDAETFRAAVVAANPGIDVDQLRSGTMLALPGPRGVVAGSRGAFAPLAPFEPESLARQIAESVAIAEARRQAAEAAQDSMIDLVKDLGTTDTIAWFPDAFGKLAENLRRFVDGADAERDAVAAATESWREQVDRRSPR